MLNARGRGRRGRGRRGRGRRGRGRGVGHLRQKPPPVDEWSLQAVGAAETASSAAEAVSSETENDVKVNLQQLFTSESNFDSHYAAQEAGRNKYLATLLVLQKNGGDIKPGAKVRALAVAWARKDHKMAKKLLLQTTEFGVVEILKAVILLDAGRKIRVWEKEAKKLQMQPTDKTQKVGKINSNIDTLNVIKPKRGSVSGAMNRHIREWTRQIPKSKLEFYALHYSKDPWKRLADICHLNPEKDFPELPWFLRFCFGDPAPEDTMVARCVLTNADNVNELVASYEVPYTHIKGHKKTLTIESKKRIAQYESKLDTVLGYYEDLKCPEVDEVIVKRLKSGEEIGMSFGKLLDRLLMLKMLQKDPDEIYGAFEKPFNEVEMDSKTKQPFYDMLIEIAEEKLQNTSVFLEAPVLVISDRSSSMDDAVRHATVIASVVCAVGKTKMSFFNDVNYDPPSMPRNIKEVLHLASSIHPFNGSAPAASLWPYYERKEVIKTLIVVTDDDENYGCTDNNFKFSDLFKKYYDEIYPARLVFVSLLDMKRKYTRMQSDLEGKKITPFRFVLDWDRPDLTKLDNILSLLAKEYVTYFEEEVGVMEVELAASQLVDDVAIMQLPP